MDENSIDAISAIRPRTLAVIILSVALDKYNHKPHRSPASQGIADSAAKCGFSLDADTVRRALQELPEFLNSTDDLAYASKFNEK